MYKEPPYHEEGNIQEKAVMMITSIEDHIGIRDYPSQSGRPPVQRGYPDRGSPRRGYPNRDGRPPIRGGSPGGGPLMAEGPLMEKEDPMMVEEPLEMEDLLGPPVDEDHQVLKDPLGQ